MLEVLESLLLSNVHGHFTCYRSTCPTMLNNVNYPTMSCIYIVVVPTIEYFINIFFYKTICCKMSCHVALFCMAYGVSSY
jgi:hypothetical protein